MQMQFGLGNFFQKKVTLEDSGIVPDIIPEMFTEKTVLRVRPPPSPNPPSRCVGCSRPRTQSRIGSGERRQSGCCAFPDLLHLDFLLV